MHACSDRKMPRPAARRNEMGTTGRFTPLIPPHLSSTGFWAMPAVSPPSLPDSTASREPMAAPIPLAPRDTSATFPSNRPQQLLASTLPPVSSRRRHSTRPADMPFSMPPDGKALTGALAGTVPRSVWSGGCLKALPPIHGPGHQPPLLRRKRKRRRSAGPVPAALLPWERRAFPAVSRSVGKGPQLRERGDLRLCALEVHEPRIGLWRASRVNLRQSG